MTELANERIKVINTTLAPWMRCEISYTNIVFNALSTVGYVKLTLLICTLHNTTYCTHDLLSGASYSGRQWTSADGRSPYLFDHISSLLLMETFGTVPDEECKQTCWKCTAVPRLSAVAGAGWSWMSDFGRSLVGVVWAAPSAAQKQPRSGLTVWLSSLFSFTPALSSQQ